MPFKSQAQRGFMFANHPELAKEFEAATPKGKKLPEHVAKMADGGEVESPIIERLRALLAAGGAPVSADVNSMASADSVDQSSGTAKMADGGEVPAIGDVMTNLNQTPGTNYDFYKDMSADDRLALQKQLMANRQSTGNLIASGAAGLGDAIANSFGGKNTTFQKDLTSQEDKMDQNALQGVDTARTQKMQDFQANLEMAGNDPNSPLSQSARQMMKAAGINVASGLPYSVVAKLAPAIGELALKQATLAQQGAFQRGQLATEEEGKRIEATKALGQQGIVSRILHPEVTKQLEEQAGMNQPSKGWSYVGKVK